MNHNKMNTNLNQSSQNGSQDGTSDYDEQTNTSQNEMKSVDELSGHDGNHRFKDHNDLDKLIETANPTHIAARSGKWSDPSTWQNGQVPDDDAAVLIKEGITVTYDQESDARIETIAIRGALNFATNKDTRLFVETILNAPEGKFKVGSEKRAVAADKNARIIFTSDSAVDTQWDPTQLSKGLISHGEVVIQGADKQDRIALAGDATAGSTVLKFKEAPQGWQIGDQIVLAGTDRTWNGSDEDNSRFQDEVLTITSIDGDEVKFVNEDVREGDRNALRFDHTRSDLVNPNKLDLYAANLSRNVSFETENGKEVPINRRAHVMLMHNPNVKVSNAGFYDLGRSDKTKIVDDVGKDVDGTKGNGTNVRGRYALHVHRTGADDIDSQAAELKGNAVSGSPGWGIVHHDSHAILEDNVVFDVAGAGIAAETGNEIGRWTNNTVIKSTGIDWREAAAQDDEREAKFDFGFEGDGYWIQGAGLIENEGNVAASANATALTVFGSPLDLDNFRDQEVFQVKNLPPERQRFFPKDQKEVDIRDVPGFAIKDFEGYNANTGLRVWGHQTDFNGELDTAAGTTTAHKGRSRIENFKLWNNRWKGAAVQYSSNVDLKNGIILGKDAEEVSGGQGLHSNQAAYNTTYKNLKIAGFKEGALIDQLAVDKDFIAQTLKNSRFSHNTYNFNKPGDEAHREDTPDDFGAFLKLKNNRFETPKNNRAPRARFSHKAAGGLAVEFDASASKDADPSLPEDGKPKKLESKGIAAYGWDFDNDGTLDDFGRKSSHVFDKPGSRQVGLTVFDSQGQENTTKRTVNVRFSDYANAFTDGNFNQNTKVQEGWQSRSQDDNGWFQDGKKRIQNGIVKLSAPGDYSSFIGQVTRNNKVHRGQQTLSFRLKNIEGAPEKNFWEKNEVSVVLWGVNGQFTNNAWEQTGPQQVGTLPMKRTKLAAQNYGGEDGDFDWKKISLDVNLGKGYDYLLFQVNAERTSNPKDFVAIDNVFLGSASSPTPALNGSEKNMLVGEIEAGTAKRDTFVLSSDQENASTGAIVIRDFTVGEDKFALTSDLAFEELSFVAGTADADQSMTFIKDQTGKDLAKVVGLSSDDISRVLFEVA